MKIKARIRWKMYNSVKKRIERRIRPWGWQQFEAMNIGYKPIKLWLAGKRARSSEEILPFYAKRPIRSMNLLRIKMGAAPVNPTIINKMYGYRL